MKKLSIIVVLATITSQTFGQGLAEQNLQKALEDKDKKMQALMGSNDQTNKPSNPQHNKPNPSQDSSNYEKPIRPAPYVQPIYYGQPVYQQPIIQQPIVQQYNQTNVINYQNITPQNPESSNLPIGYTPRNNGYYYQPVIQATQPETEVMIENPIITEDKSIIDKYEKEYMAARSSNLDTTEIMKNLREARKKLYHDLDLIQNGKIDELTKENKDFLDKTEQQNKAIKN